MKFTKIKEPWEHFILERIFNKEQLDTLINYPTLKSDYKNADGFRDTIGNRIFLNDKFVNNNPQFKDVMNFINSKTMWSYILDIDLENTYLRPELIDDRYPFEHEVHTDHPDKLVSILIYIDKDDEKNLASDLYIDENTHYKKLKWESNSGVGWVNETDNNKWHGFKSPKYKGKRRILILNWVNKDTWNDETQLYMGYYKND